MTSSTEPSGDAGTRIRAAAAVVAALVIIPVDTRILSVVPWPSALVTGYGWPLLTNLFDLALLVLLVRTAGGVDLSRQVAITGVGRPVRPAFLWGLLLFVPATAFLALAGHYAPGEGLVALGFKGVLFPVFEELVFRGLAIGVLMHVAGWRFFHAALLPSLVFGLIHAVQGHGLSETLYLMAITGIGSFVFGWLYVRWGSNLWPPVLLHVGLNSLWMLFDLGDNAIGGWLGGGLRLAVLAAALAMSVWSLDWLRRTAGEGGGRS